MNQVSVNNVKDYILNLAKQNGSKIDGEIVFNVISKLECKNEEKVINSVLIYLKKNNIIILDQHTEEDPDDPTSNLLSLEEEREYSAAIMEAKQAEILLKDNPDDIKLLNAIEKGKYAIEMMVEYNLRLVYKVAKNYMRPGLDFLDLVGEGNLGLMKAIHKYDYHLGFRFSTYAYNWIRQAISKAVKSKYGIGIPLYIQNDLNIILKKQDELMQELNCNNVTVEQIAEALNGKFTVQRITELLALNFNVLSLDINIDDSSNSKNLHEVIADESSNDFDYPIGWEKLTEREQDIIMLFYFEKIELKDIALKYNISINRIRQIKDKAKRKLEKYRKEELENK